ncbi:MAG: hypothetical protein C4525_12540 [Desulfarculus sp.]|nr:MAG: hypothetical protein C4525_12540 [Desulfarculus sp.]
MHKRRLAAGLAVLFWLASLAACGQVFLDPGPNPARVQVKLRAQAPDGLKQSPGERVYWDWGLYLVTGGGPLPLLQPTQPQQFQVISGGNSLVRDTVFLAPTGQRTLRLLVSGYVFRSSGEGQIAVTLVSYSQDYKLNLAPGGSYTIQIP